METKTIIEAREEAKRFLAAIDALEAAVDADGDFPWSHPKQTGALRRASMDLTRKLADMRAGR